jgi:hypothetical protein
MGMEREFRLRTRDSACAGQPLPSQQAFRYPFAIHEQVLSRRGNMSDH